VERESLSAWEMQSKQGQAGLEAVYFLRMK
jgi:hypothetical protein